MSNSHRNKKKIVYITDSYPFGKGEITFVKPELVRLMEYFDITIVSCGNDDQNCDESFFQDNGIGLEHYKRWDKSVITKFVFAFRTIIDVAFWAEFLIILRDRKLFTKRIHSSFWFVYESIMFREWLRLNNLIDRKSIYYTYWYYAHTLSCVKLKRSNRIEKIITRAHGYDVHGYELKGKRECCKKFMDSWLDAVFFISAEGKKYYCNTERINDTMKHYVYHLGAPAAVWDVNNSFCDNRKDVFTIISCSSLNIWKRVGLLVEALSLVEDHRIKWIHFGDGELYQSISNLADVKLRDKKNIEYEFAGHVDRSKLYRYYSKNEANCYILLSSSEGLPVANMEALANGLPVITTDVGGCYETVNSNGILLEANPKAQDVMNAIVRIIEATEEEFVQMRINSYKLWKESFDVDRNMTMFSEFIYQNIGKDNE